MSEPHGGTGMYVEGVDYTPEGILALRRALIHYRDEAITQWPTTIAFTVDLSHAIAILDRMAHMMRGELSSPARPARDAGLAEDIAADRAYWNDKYDGEGTDGSAD